MCPAIFRTVDLLIEHTETVHFQGDKQEEVKKPEPEVIQPKQNKEAERCPECFKRFSIEELPTHMQQDHFIF